ncbi:MAG: ABC transporter ATP-binding protein [Eubacteriales bacterium]
MKRWYKYIKPYLPYFILGPLCMIVEVIGEVLMPKFLSIVIDEGTDGTLTVGVSIGVAALMILTAVLMMLGGVGGAYFGGKASVNFAADLREDVYRKVQKFSFANIDKFSTGSLVTRLTNDVTQMQNIVNMMLRMMLRAPGMLIGALIMAIMLKPSLATVLAVSIPLLLLSVVGIVRMGFPRFSKMQTKVDGLNNTVQESVTNVRVVKSFVREDHETEKFRAANRDLKESGMAAMRVMIFMQPVMTIFMNLTTLAVIWFGGNIVLSNGMKIGELSAFITYVTQILSSLMMVTMMLMMSSRALASARRISDVLDEKVDLNDETAAHPDLTVQKGEITFEDVTFRYYKDSTDPVLDHIDLKIAAGSTVGIIGSTGCGKTSLVSLIPRLYDVDAGAVKIDGVDVRDYSLYHLREGVGMVLQKNVLFSGTIEENLRWGDENASDDEMKKAAESAQADKFVSSFPDGYDTMLDQGGVNVSGGQKQRLCIARALLKKPKIIILDDSTSAVDTATEAQIRKAFRTDLSGSTKIIIAQRIGSVKDADQIVVMDDGKITGIGTHDELLANNVEYQEIYYSQMDKEGK